ncbi:MAG: hypothetical protein J6R26_07255 [Paludibacteraceae bacterium]|nr:hypothetical protein [Paludibacteraceae bacterium]
MADKTTKTTDGLTIVANINDSALKYGVLTVANEYHESLVQLHPTLTETFDPVYFNVRLNGEEYKDQLYLKTTGFKGKWKRDNLNIRIFLKGNLKKLMVKNCVGGETLYLALLAEEPCAFIANIVKR